MNKKRKGWLIGCLVVIAALIGWGGLHLQREQAAAKYINSRTTTFFFHG